MNIKVKKQYEGIILTRMILGVGEITFDPNNTSKEHYINFYNLGFDFIFEEIVEEIQSKPRKNSIKSKILQNGTTN
jgi:hypothetical protein